jgi:hypothetical protein
MKDHVKAWQISSVVSSKAQNETQPQMELECPEGQVKELYQLGIPRH